jgi:hypothetical protein
MRATLSDSSLARDAGRFVWLELDYDKPVNQAVIAHRGVVGTPTLYIVDPVTERATATHLGGFTVPELNRFLDEGERVFRGSAKSPADLALAHGDEMLGLGRLPEAAAAYREGVRLLAPGGPERMRAIGSLTWTLWLDNQSQSCAEIAVAEAPAMPRGETFGSVVLAGVASSNQGGDAPWARRARTILQPLATEAVDLPAVLRDHRFQIYQHLMMAAQRAGDTVTVARWGHRWLREIDATRPKDDDERSALDIARVDAASAMGEPELVLPALAASERAMPTNYNASLKHAQMAFDAKRYDEVLGACDRGLAHVTGPVGRTTLLVTKANALDAKGDKEGNRRALQLALQSAKAIGNTMHRDHMVQAITRAIGELDKPAR